MSERERDSEVIEVDNDITAPGASKQTNRTVTNFSCFRMQDGRSRISLVFACRRDDPGSALTKLCNPLVLHAPVPLNSALAWALRIMDCDQIVYYEETK
jgi:hypothetical protein